MKIETNFWGRLKDAWRFVQMSQCVGGVSLLPLAPACLQLWNGREADDGERWFTGHPLNDCPTPPPIILPNPTGMYDADPKRGSGWACSFGGCAPVLLPQSTSEVLPWVLRRAGAWVTKQDAKTRSFLEALHVLGFCFVLPPASSWLKSKSHLFTWQWQMGCRLCFGKT